MRAMYIGKLKNVDYRMLCAYFCGRRLKVTARIINPLALIWSVLGIELTLYWNSISGVYTIKSTGQLIPFVIGLTGLLKIGWNAVEEVSLIFLLDVKESNPLTSSKLVTTYQWEGGRKRRFWGCFLRPSHTPFRASLPPPLTNQAAKSMGTWL